MENDIIYDFEIREDIEDIVNDNYETFIGSFNDYQVLRVGTEILKNATERLNNDMEEKAVIEEYNELKEICNKLDIIIEKYV